MVLFRDIDIEGCLMVYCKLLVWLIDMLLFVQCDELVEWLVSVSQMYDGQEDFGVVEDLVVVL